MGCPGGTLSIIFCSLLLVQIISLIAFISAVQLIYEMTIWLGCLSLKALKALAGALSANEQPAFRSGNTTFFDGLRILAVSAIKCTPAKTIMSAFVFSACCARPRLSPI